MNQRIGLTAVLITVSCFAAAQDQAPAKTSPVVKLTPITHTSPASGKGMYENYCAVCHGTDGKGGGPAASAMKTVPPDLTILAKREGGKYPDTHVATVIRGQVNLASHGSKEMPVWGPLFSSISSGHDVEVQRRVSNLVTYIGSMQAK